ncbi:MAG: hypothetical protein H6703_14810 [Myxococcales bacterium]|nr:hypothetical protein [Myxococcales bacterium]MCB9543702.1 hypothetical protein [Myxococcales bacterium]MCB9551367.1 hypothetical protein [Myxococcales bacterium]
MHTPAGRPLGALEYVVAVADRAAPLNFVMVAALRGAIDVDRLRAALAAMQRLHPLLAMRLAPAGRRLAFAAGAGAIPLTTTEAAPAAVPALCAAECMARLPEETGPLLRAVWVRHDAAASTLLLTFHHAIGDGTAGAFLLRDLLQAMTSEVSSGTLPAAIEDHLPLATRRGHGLWAHLGFLRRALGRIRRLRGVPGYRVAGAPRAAIADCRPRVVRRDVPPALLARLAERCRREGTTLHGALGAALLLAAHAVSDGRPVIGLGSPVNLRERLTPPVGGEVGLFITMVAGLHRLRPAPALWDLAREVRHELHGMAENGDVFAAIPFQARRLASVAPWLGRGVAGARRFVALMRSIWLEGIGLSNLGRLSIASAYGEVAVESVGFCAAPTVFGDLAVFAATLGDRLCLHFVGVMPHVPAATLDAIADDMLARVEGAVH